MRRMRSVGRLTVALERGGLALLAVLTVAIVISLWSEPPAPDDAARSQELVTVPVDPDDRPGSLQAVEDERAVRSVVSAFYQALHEGDHAAAAALWDQSAAAVLMHGDQPPVRGWPAVAEQLQVLGREAHARHATLGEIRIRVRREVAEAACVEDVSGVGDGGVPLVGRSISAHILRRTGGGWKLVARRSDRAELMPLRPPTSR